MGRFLLAFLFLFGTAHAEEVTARSWVVADAAGVVIDSLNSSTVRSIASITKLLTVMVVLDANQDLDERIKTPRYRTTIPRGTLMDMALVRSDNAAADLLCQRYPTGYSGCVRAMNEKAVQLGMTDTRFFDPTGLNKKNVSTAVDLIKLVAAAGSYPLIVEAGSKDTVSVQANKRQIDFKTTNPLVGQDSGIIVSKTGFINRAGGCLVMMLNTVNGIRTVILLGSKNTHTRAPEALFLATKYENSRTY